MPVVGHGTGWIFVDLLIAPGFPLGPIVVGLPVNVLQAYFVWLTFKFFIWLGERHFTSAPTWPCAP